MRVVEAPHHARPGGTRTEVVCSKCGKETSVPFAPTPGRPVFCRECFSSARPADGGSRGAPRPMGRGPPMKGPPTPKQRMMAQGRKGHFIHDARSVLAHMQGGMEDQHARAFLEGLFARGARTSTEAAQLFLEEKVKDGAVTHEQAIELGKLIDRYSFFR